MPDWLAGALTPTVQPDDGVTLTRPLRRSDGRLDPGRDAVQLERQVRALQPWPGSYLETPGGRLIVWRAAAVPGQPADVPGMLAVVDAQTLTLATADGRMLLLEVQPAGRRRMSAAEFLRGRPRLT